MFKFSTTKDTHLLDTTLGRFDLFPYDIDMMDLDAIGRQQVHSRTMAEYFDRGV